MSAVSIPTRVSSDSIHFRRNFAQIPLRANAQLRQLSAPIVWLTRHSIWRLSRYDPVRAVLNIGALQQRRRGGIKNYFLEKPWRRRA